MKTATLTIKLPQTVPATYARPNRWVVPGLDRDGDPCIVLNFDFGSCRIQQFLYCSNAPAVKFLSTRQFLESSGCTLEEEGFDAAFEKIRSSLDSLSAIDVEADRVLGGFRIVAYHFRKTGDMG